jgi:hypothetical protein
MKTFLVDTTEGMSDALYEQVKSELFFLPNGKYQVTIGKPKLTSKQMRSIYLYCEWIADGLNNIAQFQRKYSIINGEVVIERKWSKAKVKADIWDDLQLTETGKDSCTKLTTQEVSDISDPLSLALNETYGHLGFNIRFPNEEDLAREKQDKKL